MNTCKGCGISEEKAFCELCEVLIPAIGGASLHLVPDELDMHSAASSIGLRRGHRGVFWSNLDASLSDTIDWIKSPREIPDSYWITDPPCPWSLDEQMKEEIENGRGVDGDIAARRRLQRGGILPDGSYLTWADGQFWIDGIPISVPYLTLEKMLEKEEAAQIDWRSMLLSLNIACSRVSPDHYPGHRQFLRRTQRYGKEVSLHPVIQYVKPKLMAEELHGELAFLNRFNREMRGGIPKHLIENLEWYRRWTDLSDLQSIQRNDLLVCRTFKIRRGRIYLNMRQELKWKKRRVPANIPLITRLLNYALSPVRHEDHQFLRRLQYGLLTSDDTALNEADVKGVEFLRSILNNDRVNLNKNKSLFLVEGVSGITWSIAPGDGPHGSRFRVRANSLTDGNLPGRLTERVCIVETPELRRLVLGDAIGTIILSLLDDVTASSEIETLEPAVRFALRSQREGQNFLERLSQHIGREYELRNRNAEPEDIRNIRERRAAAEELAIRATVHFPRLWSVLLRLPLSTTLTFTRMDDGNSLVQFQDYQTRITLRNKIEENLVHEMLIASGWIGMGDLPNGLEHPHGAYRMYTRMEYPRQNLANATHRFGELLEPMITIGQRMRIVPGPVWANFERRDPGVGPLPPNTNEPLD